MHLLTWTEDSQSVKELEECLQSRAMEDVRFRKKGWLPPYFRRILSWPFSLKLLRDPFPTANLLLLRRKIEMSCSVIAWNPFLHFHTRSNVRHSALSAKASDCSRSKSKQLKIDSKAGGERDKKTEKLPSFILYHKNRRYENKRNSLSRSESRHFKGHLANSH